LKNISELENNVLELNPLSVQSEEYKIPDNWMWTKLKYVADWGSGGTPKSTNSEYYNGNIPWLVIGDLNDRVVTESQKKITELGLKNSSAKIVQEGSILIGMYGSIGKLGIAGFKCTTNQAIAFTKEIKTNVNSKYLFYYLLRIRPKLLSLGKGGTQQNISQAVLKEIDIPLPPLAEQKRIAEKVENLLIKIDEAKRLIEEVKKSFELRRAAILDKAFRGELTNNLQIETPLNAFGIFTLAENLKGYYEIPQSWKWTQLKDVAEFKNGYAFKSKDFVQKGIQVIRMGNLYKNNLNLDKNPIYVPVDYNQKTLEKYSINNGDILISLTGTKYKRDYGYAVRVEGIQDKIVLNQRILSLKPYFLGDYIFYYLKSNTFRNNFFEFETGGVNQGNVGSKAVESILIPIPSRSEAKMIEVILKSFFDKEEKSLRILSIENNIETLRQSILAEAFSGRLVTDDLSNESIIDVLNLEIE